MNNKEKIVKLINEIENEKFRKQLEGENNEHEI